MNKYVNTLALVTGASSGIGKDITLRLIKHGMYVIGCSRNVDKIKEYSNKSSNGERIIPYKCDLTSEEEIKNMFEFIKTQKHDFSVLINNAGFSKSSSIFSGNPSDWKTMCDVNLTAPAICAKHAFPIMKKLEKSSPDYPGFIININAILCHKVIPFEGLHFYSATKFGLKAITESIRYELRDRKSFIRVGQISPGFVLTEFAEKSFGKEAANGLVKHYNNRPQLVEDITNCVELLLSTDTRCNIQDIVMQPTSSNI